MDGSVVREYSTSYVYASRVFRLRHVVGTTDIRSGHGVHRSDQTQGGVGTAACFPGRSGSTERGKHVK